MKNIENHLIRIDYPKGPNVTFNTREKHMNVEIQKQIDTFANKGFTVIEKTPITKTSTHATVKFVVQKIR
jgi:hypothetical protein